MSERTGRKNRIAAVLLMAAAACMILAPFIAGILRTDHSAGETFHAGGRDTIIPDIPASGGTISVNEADPEELRELYGIGETLAGMIITERETNGPFYYPEDLTQVKGIGLKKLEGFREMIDLN